MRRRPELRADGIAAIVLQEPASVAVRRARRSVSLVEGCLACVVLGTTSPRHARLVGLGLLATVAVHAGLVVATARWSAGPRGVARSETTPLRIDHVVELDPPALPSPAEPEPAEPPPPRAEPARRAAPALREAEPGPPPPAAAAQVVAAEPRAAEALDFTGFDIATGQGREYAGGITASSGTNTQAFRTREVDRNAVPGPSRGSLARPVGSPATEWNCPWPREAEALSIDEETVLLRVVVRADGSVASTELVSDPGHGFGEVAVACARGQRFPPARDDAGNAVTATSPPIRVRFTRP